MIIDQQEEIRRLQTLYRQARELSRHWECITLRPKRMSLEQIKMFNAETERRLGIK